LCDLSALFFFPGGLWPNRFADSFPVSSPCRPSSPLRSVSLYFLRNQVFLLPSHRPFTSRPLTTLLRLTPVLFSIFLPLQPSALLKLVWVPRRVGPCYSSVALIQTDALCQGVPVCYGLTRFFPLNLRTPDSLKKAPLSSLFRSAPPLSVLPVRGLFFFQIVLAFATPSFPRSSGVFRGSSLPCRRSSTAFAFESLPFGRCRFERPLLLKMWFNCLLGRFFCILFFPLLLAP